MSSELSLPKISLVIPAWNEAAYLPRLLDTVDAARKLYRHGSDRIEVIVADNESTDETPQIAAARGCHVEHVPKRLIAAARNGGAAAARGDTAGLRRRRFPPAPRDVQLHRRRDAALRLHRRGYGTDDGAVVVGNCGHVLHDPAAAMALSASMAACGSAVVPTSTQSEGMTRPCRLARMWTSLRRLKRLGASRRPKQKLATRFTARKIGIPPALVLNSSRKWDKHGDWHMFPDVVRGAFYLLFARRKLKDYARRYWYEDRT